MNPPLRIGIRIGGAVDQGQAQGFRLSPVSIFAVADQRQGRTFLPQGGCAADSRHVVVQRRPQDAARGNQIPELTCAVIHRRPPGQHRHGIAALLLPVDAQGNPQGPAARLQGVLRLGSGGCPASARNLPCHFDALPVLSPFRPAHLDTLVHRRIPQHPPDFPCAGAAPFRVQPFQARALPGLQQLRSAGQVRQGADPAGPPVDHDPHQAVVQHCIVKQPGYMVPVLKIHRIAVPFLRPQDHGRIAHRGHLDPYQQPEVPVIPVPLGLGVQGLAGQLMAFRVQRAYRLRHVRIIPHCDLRDAIPCLRQRIEHMVHPGQPASPLRCRHPGEVLDAEPDPRALGLGVEPGGLRRFSLRNMPQRRQIRGVNLADQRRHGLLLLGIGDRRRLLIQPHGVFSGIQHAGAGNDVVEMRKQHVPPGFLHLLFRHPEPGFHPGQRSHRLRVIQSRLRPPVAAFDPALGRIAAGGKEVHF